MRHGDFQRIHVPLITIKTMIISVIFPQKKARVTTSIEDKAVFRAKNSSRDKEGYFIVIKGSFHEQVGESLKSQA